MSQITAIIHISQRSGFAPARYGQFVRADGQPNGQKLHMWLGRELTIAEFNEQFPKAVKSVPDEVFAKIIERPDENDTVLKSDHEKAMSAVQAGVDEFTKQCNDIIATKDTRILELEKALAAVPTSQPLVNTEPVVEPLPETVPEVLEQVPATPVVEPVTVAAEIIQPTEEAPKTESVVEASHEVVVEPTVNESLTVEDTPAAAPSAAPAPAAAPAAAPKPKAAAKKAGPKPPKNTDSK